MAKITDKSLLETAPSGLDIMHIVDVSDTTHSPQGTSKKIKKETLFADYATKQELNTHGAFLYFPSPSVTNIINTGEYVKINGTTTTGGYNGSLTLTNNKIQYTGTTPMYFTIHAQLSVQCVTANQAVSIKTAKNGIVDDATKMSTYLRTANELYNLGIDTFVQLEQDDYLELFIANNTSTADITVDNLHFIFRSAFVV